MPLSYSISHKGKLRKDNQDRIYNNDRLGLYVLCDGIGGTAGGADAAQIGVETIAGYISSYSQKVTTDQLTPQEGKRILHEALTEATKRVFKSGIDTARQKMGSTVVAIWIIPCGAIVAYLGDSNAYLVRQKQLYKLTPEPHTYGVEMVREGYWTEEEAAQNEMSRYLSRFLGKTNDLFEAPEAEAIKLDVVRWIELMEGDRILSCSDGLEDELPNDKIWGVLNEAKNPQSAVDSLLELSLSGRARDNISCIVIDIDQVSKAKHQKASVSALEKMEALRRLHFFHELDFTETSQILELAETRSCPAGSFLMKEGEQATNLWIIIVGQAEVFYGGKKLATLGAGSCLGESALRNKPSLRTATVSALTDLHALVLDSAKLRELQNRMPVLGAKVRDAIIDTLITKLQDQNEKFSAIIGREIVEATDTKLELDPTPNTAPSMEDTSSVTSNIGVEDEPSIELDTQD